MNALRKMVTFKEFKGLFGESVAWPLICGAFALPWPESLKEIQWLEDQFRDMAIDEFGEDRDDANPWIDLGNAIRKMTPVERKRLSKECAKEVLTKFIDGAWE